MRAVVTGAAGFIGSHLCDRLLRDGHAVIGLDSFVESESCGSKAANIASARRMPSFSLCQLDLAVDEIRPVLFGADVVFHLAGRSRLGTSRQAEFGGFVTDNVLATQRLLDAVTHVPVKRFVFASSHSVYGDAERLPTKESAMPRPVSFEGITKLGAENLVLLYGRNERVPVTVLRYFSVYGPRQRPDMAIARFARAVTTGDQVEIYGDGEQTRDFTYVDDVVEATVRASRADVEGEVLNIGGGSLSTLNGVLTTLEDLAGRKVARWHLPASAADQRHSSASINKARQKLEWEPRVSLRSGLAVQLAGLDKAAAHHVSAIREAVTV